METLLKILNIYVMKFLVGQVLLYIYLEEEVTKIEKSMLRWFGPIERMSEWQRW